MDSVSDSSLTLPRRQRERLQRRRDIFRAAERVFAKKNYHEASIEEIARILQERREQWQSQRDALNFGVTQYTKGLLGLYCRYALPASEGGGSII